MRAGVVDPRQSRRAPCAPGHAAAPDQEAAVRGDRQGLAAQAALADRIDRPARAIVTEQRGLRRLESEDRRSARVEDQGGASQARQSQAEGLEGPGAVAAREPALREVGEEDHRSSTSVEGDRELIQGRGRREGVGDPVAGVIAEGEAHRGRVAGDPGQGRTSGRVLPEVGAALEAMVRRELGHREGAPRPLGDAGAVEAHAVADDGQAVLVEDDRGVREASVIDVEESPVGAALPGEDQLPLDLLLIGHGKPAGRVPGHAADHAAGVDEGLDGPVAGDPGRDLQSPPAEGEDRVAGLVDGDRCRHAEGRVVHALEGPRTLGPRGRRQGEGQRDQDLDCEPTAHGALP